MAVPHSRIELRNVNLHNVPDLASPLCGSRSNTTADKLYDLDGEFGISESAYAHSDLNHELQEALSML